MGIDNFYYFRPFYNLNQSKALTEFIYNLAIRFYFMIASVLGLFQKKARLFVSGREGLLKKMEESIKTDSPIIWIHCSSAGEFEQAIPIIEKYRERSTVYKILLTFFSPSGYEQRKNYKGADWVFYLPVDTSRNAKAFLDIVNPKKIIFIKYDFWYNYLTEAFKRDIPIYVVSAIFQRGQIFFRWYGHFFKGILSRFTKLFVQDTASFELLSAIGLDDKVEVVGDTRFDRVTELLRCQKENKLIEQFCSSATTMIVGSSWQRDEENIVKVLSAIPYCKIVIAPHEVDEPRIKHIETLFRDCGTLRYSEMVKRYEDENSNRINPERILILDCIGLLSFIYRYGDIAYIGGGFGAGIHNILEPSVYGLPVIFGPNYSKFKEANDLINLSGAISYSKTKELKSTLTQWLSDDEIRNSYSHVVEEYVKANTGATSRILSQI